MPFSQTTNERTEDYWTKHFDTYLKPLIESFGIEAHRSKALRGDILRQIITDLVVSPIVVADLTDNNPNVYWELGVRQSFKHCTITIAEFGTKLFFDVSGKGTLFYYPKDHLKDASFRKSFEEAIKDCQSRPSSPDSHVLETLSGRGTLFQIIQRDAAMRRLAAVFSEITKNTHLFNFLMSQVKSNRENKKERKIVTRRFGWSAAEMLVTDRYLDADSSFYELAELYLADILALNDQLSIWEKSSDRTEEWFLVNEEPFTEIFRKFQERIEELSEKLRSVL